MPSTDYANAVSGGLKLKGKGAAKDARITKQRPKVKSRKSDSSKSAKAVEKQLQEEESSALQEALAAEEEEGNEAVGESGGKDRRESELQNLGKTESQRRFEEQRRKRVGPHFFLPSELSFVFLPILLTELIARRPPQARRHQDAQGAGGGAE